MKGSYDGRRVNVQEEAEKIRVSYRSSHEDMDLRSSRNLAVARHTIINRIRSGSTPRRDKYLAGELTCCGLIAP